MVGFYESKRETADQLIQRFGTAVTITDAATGDVLNQDTGSVTSGTATSYTAKGVLIPRRETRKGGRDEVKGRDETVYLSAQGLSYTPKIGDRLTLGAAVYGITDVVPLAPAGVVVLYTLKVVQ